MRTLTARWFPGPAEVLSYEVRARLALIALGLVAVLLASPLAHLAQYAHGHDLQSHVLLIPFIAAWLLHKRRRDLAREHEPAPVAAGIALLGGTAALLGRNLPQFDESARHALLAGGVILLVFAIAFLLLGAAWVRSAAFPLGFLFFAIPLPDAAVAGLETALQNASATAAHGLFLLFDVPFSRDGNVFRLPEIALRVAPECSGLRSTWVLFIVGVVASQMFLRNPGHRLALALFVIPLGILRNGFRILVIALLCVEIGPEMVDGVIHRRGGPFFFALSLVPLGLFALWLMDRERKQSRRTRAKGPAAAMAFNSPAQ